ncbi:MAG: phenylacetic acid degradation operon negative regulatory protein PaaX [Woeseiaceae bacterium]|nr:phenylacetic acid degradation operon negative regulatory protein PaaX [Woeseiaceae bacterium]
MSLETECSKLLDELRARPTVRAGSLITTVFGDSIAPRGGTLWLGSLISIMKDFGISERLVRTSVYRLANDNWLESEQVGRRAYYRLTADGRERFRAATHRIYSMPTEGWDGYWCMLMLFNLQSKPRELARRELGWLGFGSLSSNVMAHPAPDKDDLDATLNRLGIAGDVVVMAGHTINSDDAMRRLTHASWNLGDLEARYRNFINRFEPIFDSTAQQSAIDSKSAFIMRTMLIQEYRKILLRDPKLPRELLPPDWHGIEAYRLCRDLYRCLCNPADVYLTSVIETLDGELPPPGAEYMARFGGLQMRTQT